MRGGGLPAADLSTCGTPPCRAPLHWLWLWPWPWLTARLHGWPAECSGGEGGRQLGGLRRQPVRAVPRRGRGAAWRVQPRERCRAGGAAGAAAGASAMLLGFWGGAHPGAPRRGLPELSGPGVVAQVFGSGEPDAMRDSLASAQLAAVMAAEAAAAASAALRRHRQAMRRLGAGAGEEGDEEEGEERAVAQLLPGGRWPLAAIR